MAFGWSPVGLWFEISLNISYTRIMISFLRGKVVELGKTYIIIDVNGVGYRVYMPVKALNILAKANEEVKVFIDTHFNQHDNRTDLYGFMKKDDLEVFGLLTSISGIGPKNGMNILSSLEMNELIAAVSKEDSDYLRKVSGLGPKTAKRLVIELKDKLDKLAVGKYVEFDLGQEVDAIDALVSLGYQRYQAQEALRLVSKKTKGLGEKVKEALKILNKPQV